MSGQLLFLEDLYRNLCFETFPCVISLKAFFDDYIVCCVRQCTEGITQGYFIWSPMRLVVNDSSELVVLTYILIVKYYIICYCISLYEFYIIPLKLMKDAASP